MIFIQGNHQIMFPKFLYGMIRNLISISFSIIDFLGRFNVDTSFNSIITDCLKSIFLNKKSSRISFYHIINAMVDFIFYFVKKLPPQIFIRYRNCFIF